MNEREARSSGHDELECEKDRDRDKCPQRHAHTLNEALISQRIMHNDSHHGATDPSSSKMARVVGMTVGAQRQGATSTGGDAHSIAIEPQRPREGGGAANHNVHCLMTLLFFLPVALLAQGLSDEAFWSVSLSRWPENCHTPSSHIHLPGAVWVWPASIVLRDRKRVQLFSNFFPTFVK
jgi:hypothetical protein